MAQAACCHLGQASLPLGTLLLLPTPPAGMPPPRAAPPLPLRRPGEQGMGVVEKNGPGASKFKEGAPGGLDSQGVGWRLCHVPFAVDCLADSGCRLLLSE